MILWFTGNTGAGKTTLAKRLRAPNTILLDGDEMRGAINRDLGLTAKDRRENNLRIARLAKLLESQGFAVLVSVICPYEALRREVQEITGCHFVYLPYKDDDKRKDCPYERPSNAILTLEERDIGLSANQLVGQLSKVG